MLWILNPRIKMMKPINKFFVQSTESPRSCMKQIFSFMLMRCKRTLISTRVSQAAGRKQHWPRHGKLEPAKKLHSTKKKKIPQLQNVNSFSEGLRAHSSHVVTHSSVPKVNAVKVSWPRGCCTTSGERGKRKKNPSCTTRVTHTLIRKSTISKE